jgi:hypothetical protein
MFSEPVAWAQRSSVFWKGPGELAWVVPGHDCRRRFSRTFKERYE